jgi:hypothetical protein
MQARAPSGQPRVTILLPALNEEAGLARTLAELPFGAMRRRGIDAEVLVVDGRSTDRTREVAREHRAVVIEQPGSGKGDAVRAGLEWARRNGTELLIVLDADFTYQAATILPLLSLLLAGSDLVIGVRRPEDSAKRGARARVHRVGDLMLNAFAAQLSRVPFLDVCSGLWGVRLDSLRAVSLTSDGFEIEAEMFLKIARSGGRVSQVPVIYRPRLGMAKLRTVRDGTRILLNIIRFARRPPSPASTADVEGAVRASADSMQLLEAVQAVCFAIGQSRLTIRSDIGRLPWAEELASRLRLGRVQVDLLVDPDLPAATTAPGPGASTSPPDPAVLSHPVVRLPALVDGPDAPATAILGIPDSDRLVYLSAKGGPAHADTVLSRSGSYRREAISGPRLSAISNLSGHLYDSEGSNELAIVSANAEGIDVEVFRRTRDTSRASVLGDSVGSAP